MFTYAANGDAYNLRIVLNEGVDINSKNDRGCTPLIIAASKGHIECIRLLLDRKDIDIEKKSTSGITALNAAVFFGHHDALKLLLDRNAKIESKNFIALNTAARQGHLDCVKCLLDTNANIESKDNDGETALISASQGGHHAVVRLLLDRNANIESKNYSGWTSLMAAAALGHHDVVRLLLDRNADIESTDSTGHTSLSISAGQGQLDVVRLLLDRNADIESSNINGQTALVAAACQGQLDVVRLLLDRNAAIESKHDNCSALVGAALHDHLDVVRLLLDRNANIDNDLVDEIENPDVKNMVSEEISHRRRRAAFDAFIDRHIEYQPLKRRIYSRCYPDGDLRVARPLVGWTIAQAVRDEHYLDEILFYVHMHVANVVTRSVKKYTNDDVEHADGTVSTMSECKDHFASSNNKTYTLMKVLADRLTDYLKPKIDLCSRCCRAGTNVCSRCRKVYYCSSECQKSHWKLHKLVCKAPPK